MKPSRGAEEFVPNHIGNTQVCEHTLQNVAGPALHAGIDGFTSRRKADGVVAVRENDQHSPNALTYVDPT